MHFGTLFIGVLLWAGCTQVPSPEKMPVTEAAPNDTLATYYNALGDEQTHKGNYAAALEHYQKSMDVARSNGDSAKYYGTQLDVAAVYEKMGEHEQAIQTAKPVLAAYIRHRDSAALGRGYATIAIFYGSAHQPQAAETALARAIPLLESHGSLIEQCAAMNQLAFTHSDRGDWAGALPLLDSALVLLKASGALDNLPGMYLNLGNCYRELQQWEPARQYIQLAMEQADSMEQLHVHARATERMSQIEEATGNPARALILFKTAKKMRDSLFNREKMRTIEELDIKYKAKEKEREIEFLKESEQKAIKTRNQSWIITGLTVSLAAIGSFFFYFWSKNRRRILRQNQQHLNDLTQILIEKNEQIRDLTARLITTPDPDSDPSDASYSPYETPILTTKDWLTFVAYFDKVHPGLIKKLRDNYPQMSESEQRLFLLLKLNMSRTELAFLCGVTTDAIKKMRQRLRKRLQLKEEDDLEAFVREFGS